MASKFVVTPIFKLAVMPVYIESETECIGNQIEVKVSDDGKPFILHLRFKRFPRSGLAIVVISYARSMRFNDILFNNLIPSECFLV